MRAVTLQLLITHSHILLRVSIFEGPWKTGFKEKDRHCTGDGCELWCSEAAGRRMGREGTMIIKWPGFTEILVSDISPSPEREGETEGDLNREETELSSCQPLGEVEQQQTRQMFDSSSTANGVYLVLTIYP